MTESIAFIPGKPSSTPGLLSRFLPPLPEGIASEWLDARLEQGSWVLDPFGSSPNLALETARAGYKVLVAANNPITQFMLDFGADPPNEDQLRAALAELASTRVGEERLETHLQNLYQTSCVQCGRAVIAQAYLWERDANAPFAKIYECNHCGDSGEHPVNQSDINLAQSFAASSLHRMRVLERIAPPGNPDRVNAEEAISVYLPRALYGLVTLINKLDGLSVAANIIPTDQSLRHKCLVALVISALDKGNNLWTYPTGRVRPKQLSASPRFRENNLWLALEEAVEQLTSDNLQVPFMLYPQYPHARGGVTLYRGPLRNLCDTLLKSSSSKSIEFEAVLTAIPRHNQAYWTLSALWAGWLWGREEIGSFKSVLRRRRYDWSWHTSALNYAFISMTQFLPGGVPFLGLVGEAESNFLCASIIAAERARFKIKGIALRAESNLAQVHWESPQVEQVDYQIMSSGLMEDHLRKSIISREIEHLIQRGEPASFLSLYTSALTTVVEKQGISKEEQISSGDEYSRIDMLLEDTLSYKHGFIRFGGGEKTQETSRLWHQEIKDPNYYLSDQVEAGILNYMKDNPKCSVNQIDRFICEKMPGLMTPPSELVLTCIESYSEEDIDENGNITLRDQDEPEKRALEIKAMRKTLYDLANLLGFSPQGDDPIIWKSNDEIIRLLFFVAASAGISRIVFSGSYPPDKSIIVLPGARANLMLYKLRYNPYLRQVIDKGWRFLKFRHLRHLLESPSLKKENLDALLALDPLTESPAQMRLL